MAPEKKQGGLPSWVIPVGIGVVVVIGILAIATLLPPSAPAPTTTGLSASGRTIGNPNSKVAVVEFSDYQWPICRDFAIGAGRQIETQYITTNKISFTYKYFPVVDQGRTSESHWAAEAAECANQQGKFWEYHDKLFSVWVGENVGTFAKPNLKKYAADLGLDAAKFNPCIDNDLTASIVQADEAQAQSLGLPGTPSFLINGKFFRNQTIGLDEFARTFESLLK
jgi:protein-disulfide isomerase